MNEEEQTPQEQAPPPDPREPETRDRSGDVVLTTTEDIPPDPRFPETAFEEPPPDPQLPETKDGGDPGDSAD